MVGGRPGDKLVFAGSDRQNATDPTAGAFLAVHADSGAVAWKFLPQPGGVYSSPAVSARHGLVFVAAYYDPQIPMR